MARLSFDGAKSWLEENGYTFEWKRQAEKQYRVSRGAEVISFETKTEVTKWVRELQQNTFDEEAAKMELEELEKKRDHYKEQSETLEDNRARMYSFGEYRKLVKVIEEKKVLIRAKGKLLSVNRVQQILKSKGFDIEKSDTTAVRGWHNHYGDFRAQVDFMDRTKIDIFIRTGRYDKQAAVDRKRGEMVKALREAGLNIIYEQGKDITVARF